jgi:hypothetical protein
MRIIIFIVFIMMIIIFLNELKNISASFFQINYIKDVADINIEKHCNDIYCEAETGRFNIAKNSYKLLLPNDLYNTKTYYFMILLIIIIFYINTFYNLVKYNNLYYPYISNDGGTVCITIIKNIPYIFAFLTLVLIIVILVARYAPTEFVGYRNYFNIDNPVVSDFNTTFNINILYNYVMFVIGLIFIVYFISTYMCNRYIYTYPQKAIELAKINQNMSAGYLIITILLTYLLFNIMNILLSFADNRYPKLTNNNYKDIIEKNYKQVLIDNIELKRENILYSCYTNDLSTLDITQAKTKGGYGHDIIYSKDNKEENRSYGITVHHNTDGSDTKIHAVLYSNIDYLSNIDHADDYKINEIKVNYYFKYISPLIPYLKIKSLTDNVKRYKGSYEYNYILYNDIHNLKNNVDDSEKIITKYKTETSSAYDAYYMIDNIRIGIFNKDNDKDNSILSKILILFDYITPTTTITSPTTVTTTTTTTTTTATTATTTIVPTPPPITTKEDFVKVYNVLLDVLLYFCINEINYWIEYESKKIYNNENLSNFEYIKDIIYPDYEKHTILLNLIKYLKNQRADSEKITATAFLGGKTAIDSLKNRLIVEINNYAKYDKASSLNKKPFFGKEYDILSNITEIKENFTADISYGSPNTFYEQYFNISNNDVSAADIEYKIGGYFIKNSKNLIYFIILIIIIAILLIIFLYRNEKASLMAFSYDIMMPLIILLIFVIYIYLFMTFNTSYNLNVIYGLFDSSYKRDLNDMNNLIIPFIKLHSNTKDKYDKDYYDLYIITNVLASFLYSDSKYDDAKYKNKYSKILDDKIIYSKEETIDYNEFKKYYSDQFTIINDEFNQDFDKINDTADKNLKNLYNYIKTNIKNASDQEYTIANVAPAAANTGFVYSEFVKSFTTYSDKKIVNIILICLELFGNNKEAYKNSKFVKENFYFEKDNNGNFIPHKFRFIKSVFDKTYEVNISPNPIVITIKNENPEIKIYITKGDKQEKIKEIANNYMNILSLFQYNYMLSDNYTETSSEVKTSIFTDAKDRGYGIGQATDDSKKKASQNYLHKYKNKRLISLISNTKGFDKAFDKKSFVLVKDTFKYAPASGASDASGASGEVMYVYTNIIETYNINVSNISDNYLENVIKTICYQVDNRDVIMNDYKESDPTNIINKNGDAHDNHVNILHKANQCISYDFATNYTANLIMIGIIYSIGLYNNKIF